MIQFGKSEKGALTQSLSFISAIYPQSLSFGQCKKVEEGETMQSRDGRWSIRRAIFAFALAIISVGCSSGVGEPDRSAKGDEELEAYCATTEAIQTSVPAAQPESEEEARAMMREFAAENFESQSEDALQSLEGADEQVLEAARVFYGNLAGIAKDGDYTVLDKPEHIAASGVVHAFDLENCGWNKVEITADEYSYAGVPAELESGPTSLDLDNVGSEVHEFTMFKVGSGVTKSVKQLIDQGPGDPEVGVSLAFLGHIEVRPEGTPDDYGIMDLEPGKYAIICYLPVGATPEKVDDPNASFEGAERHYSRGMISEFTVG